MNMKLLLCGPVKSGKRFHKNWPQTGRWRHLCRPMIFFGKPRIEAEKVRSRTKHETSRSMFRSRTNNYWKIFDRTIEDEAKATI